MKNSGHTWRLLSLTGEMKMGKLLKNLASWFRRLHSGQRSDDLDSKSSALETS